VWKRNQNFETGLEQDLTDTR